MRNCSHCEHWVRSSRYKSEGQCKELSDSNGQLRAIVMGEETPKPVIMTEEIFNCNLFTAKSDFILDNNLKVIAAEYGELTEEQLLVLVKGFNLPTKVITLYNANQRLISVFDKVKKLTVIEDLKLGHLRALDTGDKSILFISGDNEVANSLFYREAFKRVKNNRYIVI